MSKLRERLLLSTVNVKRIQKGVVKKRGARLHNIRSLLQKFTIKKLSYVT